MPDIRIHRDHHLGLAKARKIAWKWAEHAEQKFDMLQAIESDIKSGLTQTKAIEQADKATANTEGDDDYKPFDDGDENEGTDQESLDRAAKQDEQKRLAANEEIKRIRIYKAIRQRFLSCLCGSEPVGGNCTLSVIFLSCLCGSEHG